MVRYLNRPHIVYLDNPLHSLTFILSNFNLFPKKLIAPRIKTCIKDNQNNLVYKLLEEFQKKNFKIFCVMEHLHGISL